ncbi:hypothetical protein GTY54_48055 [Streptomyces sp. SID625]|nr:hypothetical protein [Streptomyces sp. SID625]
MTGHEAARDGAGRAAQSGQPRRSPYQMRLLATGAEQAEARALIEDRTRWLAERNLPAIPAAAALPAGEPGVNAIGIFDDDELVGCLALHPRPGGLSVTRAYGRPGADFARLATLWASDYAARCAMKGVRTVVVCPRTGPFAARHRLETHLTGLGWSVVSHNSESARLQLAAEARPLLTALIHCAVPLPQAPLRSTP